MLRWRDVIPKIRRTLRKQDRAADVPAAKASGALTVWEAAQRDTKTAALLALLWPDKGAAGPPEQARNALPPRASGGGLEVLVGDAMLMGMRSIQRKQEAHSLAELATFIHKHTPAPPRTGDERTAALTAGLTASLRHNLRELRQTDETFPITHLSDAVDIGAALQLPPLHAPLCELLVGTRQVIQADADGPRIAPLQGLRRRVRNLLAALPPDQTPVLWQMLRDPHTTAEFWPVLALMRQPSALPYLLDAIPAQGDEGRTGIVLALQNIGDVQALPYLRQLAQARSGKTAPLAAAAIAHILKHHRGESAQLLRAADVPDINRAGDALLRPVHSGPGIAPEHLLRPASLPQPDTAPAAAENAPAAARRSAGKGH